MIDQDIAPEFEALLRTTLAEMIPKVVAAAPTARVADRRVPRSSRRFVAIGLTAAACFAGLVVVATRDSDSTSPAETVPTGDTAPAWYRLLRPLLPERFDRAALVEATDRRLSFVAIDESGGKALEITLSADRPQSLTSTTIDSTGTWEETAQGFRVVTAAGLLVEVSCDVGARGIEFSGPPNYCEMPTTGPFTKTDVRAFTVALAATFDTSVLGAASDLPTVREIDHSKVVDLVLAAVPSERTVADTDRGPADRVIDFSADGGTPSTSLRIVQGVYPTPPATATGPYAIYDDAAAFWVISPEGLAIRVGTVDPSADSLARLRQVALDVLAVAARAPTHGATPPPSTVLAATTSIP